MGTFQTLLASDFCLVFFVRKKHPKGRLRHLARVPRHLAIDTLGMKVLTDVQEWGGTPVAHGPLRRARLSATWPGIRER